MKKRLFSFFAAAMILFAACAAAATVEKVEPIRIHGDLYITDYGFGIVKRGELAEQYGCYLDGTEANEAEGWDPCGYFTITNNSEYGENIDSIYVRGGTKYNWYWNWKSQYIPANSSKTYWCSGYETIQGFRGAWSVDCKLGKKNYVSRYTLSR